MSVTAALLVLFGLASPANQPPVVDNFSASAASVAPGGALTFTVNAHDPDCSGTCTTGCGTYIRADLTSWSSSAGTFTSTSNGASASPYSSSATWQAPSTEGTCNITVVLYDSGTSFGCGGRLSATGTLSVTVTNTPPNLPPSFSGFAWDRNPVPLRDTSVVTVSASDPEGDPITFSWSSDAGTVAASTPGSAIFTAPSYPFAATVTCTATDSKGASTSGTTRVSVTSARADRMLAGPLRTPNRVAAMPDGSLAVADAGAGGIVTVEGQSGRLLSLVPLENPVSVAVDWADRLVVGVAFGALVSTAPGSPSFAPLDPGQGLGEATDVAVDGAGQRYAVLYGNPGRVVLFDALRNVVAAFGSNGDAADQFKGAVALAIAPTGEILVGDAGHGLIHVFDQAGNQVRAFGGLGSGTGQFVQIGGMAVDATGLVYVSDAYQSWVHVFSLDGTYRETLGQYGPGVGEFMTPSGIALKGNPPQLVVASLNSSSLQVFSSPNGSANRPPTLPAPMAPSQGAELPVGSPVALSVYNAFDPEGQPLQIAFELYGLAGGVRTLLNGWTVPQTPPSTTQVDASAYAAALGDYVWRARAFDGVNYSPWSADGSFFVVNPPPPPNQAPSAPGIAGPDGAAQVATLEPTLVALDASDPDGDALSYTFEAAILVGGGYSTVAGSAPVTAGPGQTAWQIPAGALQPSLPVYWRCRAFDGKVFGPWSPYALFWTPPFPVPSLDEVGNLPVGDAARPGEVRYELAPGIADVTLYFQVYDVTADELSVEVMGKTPRTIPAQVAGDWSRTVSVVVPASELSPDAASTIRFIHASATDPWGIRNVALVPPVSDRSPELSATAYNTVVDLSWTPDPALPPGTTLRVYSCTGLPAVYFWLAAQFAPEAATPVRQTDLNNDVAYSFKAAYVWPDGREGPPSPVVTVTPEGGGGPTPITDLRVRISGADLVLTWTPVTSEPTIQAVDVYTGVLGNWAANPSLGTPPVATVGALDSGITLRGAASGSDLWISAVPFDLNGTRATP